MDIPKIIPKLNTNKADYDKKKLADIALMRSAPLKSRKISKEVCDFYNVRASFNSDGEIVAHYYPYEGGKAWKVRELPKQFSWVGKSEDLFGRDKFNGAGRRVIVCEGEIDVLSVAQASWDKYSKIYPTVGVSSAGMDKSLLSNRDWLRSFQEIILIFDPDQAGEDLKEKAIKILGIDKVKIAKLPHKDPNEVLLKASSQTLLQCVFDAAPHIPSGIISKEALWQQLQDYNSKVSVPYPPCLEGVNAKIKGMRDGEIALLISGTGSGKSTILREIMLHILETTEEKIGVVSLEESPAETARKLSGMVIKRNPAKEEISLEDLKPGFDAVFGKDRVILLDHQGSLSDGSIMNKLEYMCLSGCRYLFIDHITILVSEGVENLTGNEAQDKVMNDLLRLVKRYPVWIGLVSHLRKTQNTGKSFEEGKLPSLDDIRGSGSIKQISMDVISFARNLTADNPQERNTIKMRILKSRYTGLTGTVPGAFYNYDTGRLEATDAFVDEEFVTL
jgi:twinkle protein